MIGASILSTLGLPLYKNRVRVISFSMILFSFVAKFTFAFLVFVHSSTSLWTSTINPASCSFCIVATCLWLSPSCPSLHSTNLNCFKAGL